MEQADKEQEDEPIGRRTPVRAVIIASLVALFAVACGSSGPSKDAGSTRSDAGDARPILRDAGPSPDADPIPDFDSGRPRDAAPRDALADRDARAMIDVGPPGPGESCETARPSPLPSAPLVSTTERSMHRMALACTGEGAGTVAPEEWSSFQLAEPRHVILRLGSDGWEGVAGVRTGTCAARAEVCSARPPVIELPSASGLVFAGVEGYSTGRGRYILTAEVSPPLAVPPPNDTCAGAIALTLPAAVEGHDFGGGTNPIASCPMGEAVFYRFTLAAPAPISIRVEPRARQEVALALLSSCGAVVNCQRSIGRGFASVIGPTALVAGDYAIAVGTRLEDRSPGSFGLSVAAVAECRSDADCSLSQRCTNELRCGSAGSAVISTTARAIPDGAAALEVPIVVASPASRPARLRVRVRLEHPSPQDLVIELRSPAAPSPITVRLRDRTPGALDTVYGSDRPPDGPGSLDDFGLVASARGTWTLRLEDRAVGNHGSILGFSFEVESR